MECLLPYLGMVTVPHNNGRIRENVGLVRFHCIYVQIHRIVDTVNSR